ncbi:MAG: response regulator [Ardenticatenia bacterium]|nr:response regulator [Ardenticatenia bacterium]
MLTKTIVALVADLFFSVRIETALSKRGYEVVVVDTVEGLFRVPQDRPALVIVDIGDMGLDWEKAIRAVRRTWPSVPVLAFGSHVDVDARNRALAAGATRVVARSRFVQALPKLVAQLVAA